jgi:TRAP-type C4-dicarboxylate transport system substrate-binding protein
MFISRYWLVVLSVMMVVAVIIGGCAPSAAPAPSSKPSTPAVSPPADKPIELRFSHQNPPVGRVTEKAINPWAKRVEEATKGKLKVTVYPANALNAPEQALEAVNGGICDIVWTPLGYYPSRFPLSDVITLPFMNLPQGKIGSRILSPGEVNSHMLQELYETSPEIQAEYKDFKVLLLHTTEPFILFSSKKPLRNQADVKGIKVRELAGPPSEMWKLLGANPMLLPMPDCYDSASKGIIDAQSASWSAVSSFKLFEVYKYYTDVPLCVSEFMILMNKDKWNSLPADIQAQIMTVSGIPGADALGDSSWGFSLVTDTQAVMQKANVSMEKVQLDPGEYDRWVEVAGKPLWDKWVADRASKNLPGKKVLDQLRSLIQKYK